MVIVSGTHKSSRLFRNDRPAALFNSQYEMEPLHMATLVGYAPVFIRLPER
jgi:hypothetical protein